MIISVSLLISLMLSILPLPVWSIWLRPQWVPLVVIYWMLFSPNWIGLGVAWSLGLLLDGLNYTLLGEHALAMLIMAYCTLHWYQRLRVFPLWQQVFGIASLVLSYQLIIYLIQGIIGNNIPIAWYSLSLLSSALVWPWVVILLRAFTQKYSSQALP